MSWRKPIILRLTPSLRSVLNIFFETFVPFDRQLIMCTSTCIFSFQSFLHDVVCTNRIDILCISTVYFFALSTLNLKWLTDGLCVISICVVELKRAGVRTERWMMHFHFSVGFQHTHTHTHTHIHLSLIHI